MANYFDTSIKYLKGVDSQRVGLLQKELGIYTFGDLIQHYPFRYEDRTKIYDIAALGAITHYVQIVGKIVQLQILGAGKKKRLVASFADASGSLELIWFKGVVAALDRVKPGIKYLVFGKPSRYGRKLFIAHPEMELAHQSEKKSFLQPVYPLSEKLRSRYLNNRYLIAIQRELLAQSTRHIRETLPDSLLKSKKLLPKKEAMIHIHFPASNAMLALAQHRLKFEELFYIQLQLIKMKWSRKEEYKGMVFNDTGILKQFYAQYLPFVLTEAQKRVIREIYIDMKSGKQMNRLLQGDVGSGKTIVAFICILLVMGGGAQAALMAPTEILAQQHYATLKTYADQMHVTLALLTGSTKKKDREAIHFELEKGKINILVGTHALIEDKVKFNRLGLAIIDEQHRFGVAQRSKLWQKNKDVYPHVLVMTATPIPRTLAMTLYGDLDVSSIDELPLGRKPIQTVHKYDANRLQINQFIRSRIELGNQVYIVYPLIDESEKLDLKHLMDGYESIVRAFPHVPVSILHGKMNPEAKEFEMNRFVKGETKIMVATTVIEVGVNVPNAAVMVIENAERFGLSQLHQLRGRVGRGADQSYCILVTNYKLNVDSRTRIKTMVRTNNGFEIAETDLQLRGPGDLVGTQQSGALELLIADLGKDGRLLQEARKEASKLLNEDLQLMKPENRVVKVQVESIKKGTVNWSRIS